MTAGRRAAADPLASPKGSINNSVAPRPLPVAAGSQGKRGRRTQRALHATKQVQHTSTASLMAAFF